MKITEKLEAYFNSGSTDKQNHRRLGGLLISITALLLAIAILVTAIGLAVTLISNAANRPNNNDDDGGDSVNTHLLATSFEEVLAKANKTGYLSPSAGEALAETSYTTLKQINRPKTPDGSNLYRCQNADNFALQNEAFAAFNAMATAFYEKEGLATLWVKLAYNVAGNNVAPYANAQALMLDYSTSGNESSGSIYGVEEYEWIYENAHNYGFVRVSNEEGEQNVFRYVGLAHAKSIQAKQKKAETFYTVEDYLAEVKTTTPNSTMSIKGVVKTLGEKATTTVYVYYMPTESSEFKLPNNNKYGFTVEDVGTGYVVSYWKL